ncbi:hypothetical protein B0H63DRAFT_45656 [Podospora didyma]|uniref:Uncharacterized protein n=1 Tax=Podospora didyma TaxID=330526 RepID=A0AAE0U8J4_9PEZI|nr:hypothetical protein B0H63DRAFT_45656 [Podospora didyma]
MPLSSFHPPVGSVCLKRGRWIDDDDDISAATFTTPFFLIRVLCKGYRAFLCILGMISCLLVFSPSLFLPYAWHAVLEICYRVQYSATTSQTFVIMS